MSYSAWKQLERRTAKALGGVRHWRQDFGESAPDGEAEFEVWDAKCYERHAAVSLWVKAHEKYREWAGKKRLLLVLYSRTNPRAGDFVLLRMADYIDLKRKAGEL